MGIVAVTTYGAGLVYRSVRISETTLDCVRNSEKTHAAAPLSLPLNYVAEEQGLNTIGRFIDIIPQFQLSVYSVRRSWGGTSTTGNRGYQDSIPATVRRTFSTNNFSPSQPILRSRNC